jgi:hypothetical protein
MFFLQVHFMVKQSDLLLVDTSSKFTAGGVVNTTGAP